MDLCKIISQEEIVVPFTHVDAYSPFLQIQQHLDYCHKLRIDITVPAEPEIKKIPQDKKIIGIPIRKI
jgi:hypothetical protein